MDRLTDERLYKDNAYALARLESGIELKSIGLDDEENIDLGTVHHCYWFGSIGRKQVFSIKSFLCTQNMGTSKVILWLDVINGYADYKRNIYLKQILDLIEVRMYDPIEEIKGTIWEDHSEIADVKYNLPQRSDAFRYLILNKYGGLYFDLDVLFLKDLGGLLNTEFCYAWENQPYANSAILNLKKKSNISNYLLKKSLIIKNVLPWNILDYTDTDLKDLYLLPSAFFDAIWLDWLGNAPENVPFYGFGGFFMPFSDIYKNRLNISSYKEFFPGCYTFHWHNQWNTIETENSFFGIFEKEFNALLNIKQ